MLHIAIEISLPKLALLGSNQVLLTRSPECAYQLSKGNALTLILAFVIRKVIGNGGVIGTAMHNNAQVTLKDIVQRVF